MKTINFSLFRLVLMLGIVLSISACQDFDNNVPGIEKGGGIDIITTSLNFPPTDDALDLIFTINYKVYQGNGGRTKTVNVYKQYAGSLGVSNKILFRTFEIPEDDLTSYYDFSFMYTDLVENLTIDDTDMPSSPFAVNVGDGFTLSYEVVLKDGSTLVNKGTSKIGVSGRYAGEYEVIASSYFRIGVESGASNWVGCTRNIVSVAPGIYMNLDGFGPFAIDGCITNSQPAVFPCPAFQQWYLFELDEESGSITWPREYSFEAAFADANNLTAPEGFCPDGNAYLPNDDGVVIVPLTGLGDEFVDCDRNSGVFTSVNCTNMNLAIPHPAGKDTIKLIYGYVISTSADPVNNGVREFMEILVRK